MLKIGAIVWGVRDIPRAIAFWSAALDYVLKYPANEDFAILVPRNGDGLQLSFNRVTSSKPRKHHMDLHSDDPDAVTRFLEEHRIPAEPRERRLRIDRERVADLPVWVFSAEELSFDLTVLPHDALRQAPLSSVDERPMKRASATQLRQLLAEEDIARYERDAARR